MSHFYTASFIVSVFVRHLYPESTLVQREIYTKKAKESVAIRKLVIWKTNKEKDDPGFPAFVVHWTDYSPGRKDPLKCEVRLAPEIRYRQSKHQ